MRPCVSALDPRTCGVASPAGLFLCCQCCDDVAAGTESPASADAGATCGTGTLGLLAVGSGIDGVCFLERDNGGGLLRQDVHS